MPIAPSSRPARAILPLVLLLLLAASAAGASGVTVTGPEPLRPSTRSFFSANGQYRVKIKPRDLLPARAVIARRQAGGRFEPIARFRLLAPVSTAAVTDDGAFLLTLPPSASGLGPDELAVYQIGPPARSFVVPGLRGLLFDATLRDAPPILDQARGHLVFGLPRWGPWCYELAIDLATGKPVQAHEDVYPGPRVTITAATPPPAPEPPAATAAAVCGRDAAEPAGPELVRLSSEELLASARETPQPSFTEVAKKARYTIGVTVDLVVSEHGRAMCVRTSPARMGLDRSAAEALRKWVFEPPQRDGRPVRAVGTVVVGFERVGGVRCRERGEEAPPGERGD